MAKVNFQVGTLAQYRSLSTFNESTLYFITDAKKIYKGNVDVTSAVEIVTAFDGESGKQLADAVEGKFYINVTTFEMRIKSGTSWYVMSPGYLSTGGEWAQADNDAKLGTIGVIKTIIGQALATIKSDVSYDNTTGTLTVGEKSAKLTGVINGLTYDVDHLQLTVSTINETGAPTQTTIDLPKDNFVRSGRYEAEYDLPEGGKGPAIVLTVGNGTATSEVVIPAASLVDVYTGASSKDITVTVSSDNKITANAIIDPVEGNALISGDTGLSVSIIRSDVADGHLAVADGKGKLKDGGVTVLTTGELGTDATKVPVASVIATAISTAVSAAQGTLQAAIDELSGRVTTLETFKASLEGKFLTSSVANNFVGFIDNTGKIKDSGKKAGGAIIAETPDENTLATEAAVAAIMSWQDI